MSTASCATNEGAEVPPRIAVRALIYSEDRPPIEITSQLDLQPTTAVKKGIKYGARTGTPVNIPRHMWCLSSEPHVPDREFSSHLDWPLGKLYPVREKLLALEVEFADYGDAE